MINNLEEFMKARGFGETTFQDIERNTYKHTKCGAWITQPLQLDGITVGSIVEGGADCTPKTIAYPFELNEFWNALENIEKQADEIWNKL